MPINRRNFLISTTAAVAASAVGVVYYTFKIGPHHLNIVHRDLPLAHLPENLKGKRLIQISDLHIGKFVDDHFMVSALKKVNELKPDILCITGDFMTCSDYEEVKHVGEIVSELEPAPLATVAVLGNHDYGHSWKNQVAANALAQELRASTAITLLRNQSIDIDGLQIFGLDDLWAEAFKPARALKQLDPTCAHLALSHNPDTADLPGWTGFNGWILSGHTHGGQCKPPFLPPPLLPVENRRYTQGVFNLDHQHATLHINPGLGYLRNVRFGTRPEISVFTLT